MTFKWLKNNKPNVCDITTISIFKRWAANPFFHWVLQYHHHQDKCFSILKIMCFTVTGGKGRHIFIEPVIFIFLSSTNTKIWKVPAKPIHFTVNTLVISYVRPQVWMLRAEFLRSKTPLMFWMREEEEVEKVNDTLGLNVKRKTVSGNGCTHWRGERVRQLGEATRLRVTGQCLGGGGECVQLEVWNANDGFHMSPCC